MNGFALMADAYRKSVNDGEMSKEQAEKRARIYDFLSTCDTDDICTLFDSTAFNEIAKDYMRLAVKHLIANGTIDEEQGQAVRNEYAYLFSILTAQEIGKA